MSALTPHPESLSKHDPATNRRFIAIFDDPDNADLVRMLTVGLAINDAPRPASPDDEAPKGGTATLEENDETCPCLDEPDHLGELAKAILEGRLRSESWESGPTTHTRWHVLPAADEEAEE